MCMNQVSRSAKPLFRRRKAGFSLAEIIVATAILAILGSVVISTGFVVSSGDRDRYQSAADTLSKLAQAVAGNDPTNTQSSFKWVVQKYPRQLSQLTTPITTAETDICGVPFSAASAARWVEPFWRTQFFTTGTILVRGFTAQNDLGTFPEANLGYRNGTTGAFQSAPSGIGFRTDGAISIRMMNVMKADAEGLDASVDGTVDGTVGTVRYALTDPTSVDYVILVSGC
jgi:prepilin-type N-terminal cleavage/methylation domain-containing protein